MWDIPRKLFSMKINRFITAYENWKFYPIVPVSPLRMTQRELEHLWRTSMEGRTHVGTDDSRKSCRAEENVRSGRRGVIILEIYKIQLSLRPCQQTSHLLHSLQCLHPPSRSECKPGILCSASCQAACVYAFYTFFKKLQDTWKLMTMDTNLRTCSESLFPIKNLILGSCVCVGKLLLVLICKGSIHFSQLSVTCSG